MSLSYFAENNSGNEQLWVADGTTAGSQILKVFVGASIQNLTMIGSRVYFSVDDGVHGVELWTSDGTSAGTVLVSDIAPGLGSGNPQVLINNNGTLFFSADDGTHGLELWESNGTAAGTFMVRDIFPGGGGFTGIQMVSFNGTVFFQADDGVNGAELWKSDGTAAGTVMVADIFPGASSSAPFLLTNVNGTLFFAASDATHGTELWKSDGTAAGTVMVKDISPGINGSITGYNQKVFANVNGTLFFGANDGTNGTELWKSDGTTAGTAMVADIFPGGSSFPFDLTNVNGTLFFAARDGVHGYELWKSDGTAAGTVMVKDINPGVGGSIASIPGAFANVNGTLFFAANDGSDGYELWKSDGTATGTVMVKDIFAGGGSSDPQQFTNVNGVLEFYAFDGTSEGLWRSDGTAAGTFELATNVDVATPIGFTPNAVVNDMNGDRMSDVLWRNASGALAGWTMNGGSIVASSALTSSGVTVNPDRSWSIGGTSDFNGDGNADVLWRNSTDGTLAVWAMNGMTITSSGVVNLGGAAVKPDASWSIIGTGDFDGDTRGDILWRNTAGTIDEWQMNGSSIVSSAVVNFAGAAVTLDASWSVAGIGDFNGDGRKDVLWRNSDGTLIEWDMNGSTVASSNLVMGGAIKPDASWNVAGIGDFNHDGNADMLWRRSDGTLAEWLMNGSTIASSGVITFGGVAVTPDASWHIVEVGDFNGDSSSDILWRNDNGSMAEWLMNGRTIMQSVTPSTGSAAISPDATWSTQARPTNFG